MGEETSATWPTFGELEEALPAASAPAYTDGLIAVVILLIALSVALYHALIRPRGRGRALLLLTAPPAAIARVGEMLPTVRFFILGLLQSFLVVAILAMLLLPGEVGVSSLSVADFWLRVGRLSLLVGGGYAVVTLIQAWMVYTFCPTERIPLWWAGYQISWIGAASLLLIPLVMRLFTSLSATVALWAVGVIYVVFRGFLCYRGLQLFPRLRRYPLHIILYLCASEIGPLLFLVEGASISVNQ